MLALTKNIEKITPKRVLNSTHWRGADEDAVTPKQAFAGLNKSQGQLVNG